MYKIKRRNKKRFYKNKGRLLLVLLVLLIGGLAFARFKDSGLKNDTNLPAQEGEYINLNPPTEEETKETEQNKKSLSEDTPTPSSSPDGKIQVTPVISFADHSEVRAYVPGIFEDGGTCTATATRGSEVKSATSTGFTDVNKTNCSPIKLAFAGSGWTVVVSYSSNAAEGKSAPYEVN